MFKGYKSLAAGLMLTAVALAPDLASAATVTTVNAGALTSNDGVVQALWHRTTVATFTTVQDIASLTISGGLWECSGQASMGTVTNASSISLGISTVSATLPTGATGTGYGELISLVVMATQANATAGFPQLTTAPAFIKVSVPTKVYLVESQSVTDTVTAALSCVKLAD